MSNCCSVCCKDPCGCPIPALGIDQVPGTNATFRYNLGGKSMFVDYTSAIQMGQTDTTLRADAVKRLLIYNAERHTDTISAKTLGSILHLADIGDVNISNVGNNSLLVYQKDSNCGEGCKGVNNSWVGWNANDHLVNSLNTVMGFDENEAPQALNHPTNTDQYYFAGWNAQNKFGYFQAVEVSTPPVDSEGYSYQLYIDPRTKQLVYVKKKEGEA